MARIILILVAALVAAGRAGAQEEFSRRLTPEEREASGLDRLTSQELAVLDALVRRERSPPGSTVPKASEAPRRKPAATPSAAAAAAPSTPEPAPNAAAANPEKRKSLFGLPAKEETEAIFGTLQGEFRGWTGSTVFRLEDGQVWVQTDPHDSHEMTPQRSPRVKIEKATFGGYKLTVEGSRLWVRVKRVQ